MLGLGAASALKQGKSQDNKGNMRLQQITQVRAD